MFKPFATIQPILDAAGSRVLDPAEGYIECPGKHLHTTPNADSDCIVYFNDDGTIISNCLHDSCRHEVKRFNTALYHLVCNNGNVSGQTIGPRAVLPKQSVQCGNYAKAKTLV